MLKLVKNMDLRSPLMDAYKNILIDALTAAPNKRMDAAALQSRINALPKTNIVRGQQKLNTNMEIGKKIKNIQSSIHYAKGQRQWISHSMSLSISQPFTSAVNQTLTQPASSGSQLTVQAARQPAS